MDNSNKPEFQEVFNALSEYYQREPLGKMALQIYFAALERFSIEQIRTSITTHVSDSGTGQFYPKASDIIRGIEGGAVSHDMVIAAARLQRTPFGMLCNLHIGSWDLARQTDFNLKSKAEQCLQLLPDWKAMAAVGDYSDNQIKIMIDHGVDPAGPFYAGLPEPQNVEQIRLRVTEVVNSDRNKLMVEGGASDADCVDYEKTDTLHPSIANIIGDSLKAKYEPEPNPKPKSVGPFVYKGDDDE